jgi:putative intracellular protease/amidase
MTDRERVAVLVYDGVAELSAVGPYDVFATAGRRGVPVDATIVTVDPREQVEAIGGLTLEPDGTLDSSEPPACLVVPGGRWSARAAAGAWAEAQRGRIPDAVAACHERGSLVAGVAAGVRLLAEGGVGDVPAESDDGTANSTNGAPGAPTSAARIAEGDRVANLDAANTGVGLALWLLEHAWGPDPARDVASMIEYDPDEGAAVG